MRRPRRPDIAATAHVFVDRLDDRITVDGDDGHHLQRSRRVRAGETVTAADGYGRWRVFTVAALGARAGRAPGGHRRSRTNRRSLPRLTVACSLTKGEKPELVVQKLTELGVDRMLLVDAARSVVRWDDAKAAAAFDRLQRVAREAGDAVPPGAGPGRRRPDPASVELAELPGLVVAARRRRRCRRPSGAPATGSGWWRSVPRAASPRTS